MLERLAKWYLRRRGVVVLSRTFVGLAVGFCQAARRGDGSWVVRPIDASRARLIVLNHSYVVPGEVALDDVQ